MVIKAVIFDLDGTLFDRATSVEACIEAQYRRFPDMLRKVTPLAYVSRFLELDARGYTKKDAVYQRLAMELSLPHGGADVLYADFYQHYHRHAVGFPELHATLAQLRSSGARLGLVTNGGEAHQRATLGALELEPYFDAILISESEGVRKPDARIFQRALDRLGVTAREAVYIGDNPGVDVDGARAAGLWTIWKRDPFWGECEHADAIVQDLICIPELLGSLGREGRRSGAAGA